MAAQINHWMNEDEWERYYDGEIPRLKMFTTIIISMTPSGTRLLILAETLATSLRKMKRRRVTYFDEVKKNIGFMQSVDAVDPSVWANYNPNDSTGTIDFSNVTEIRYETRSWESVSDGNPYREADEDWEDQTSKSVL